MRKPAIARWLERLRYSLHRRSLCGLAHSRSPRPRTFEGVTLLRVTSCARGVRHDARRVEKPASLRSMRVRSRLVHSVSLRRWMVIPVLSHAQPNPLTELRASPSRLDHYRGTRGWRIASIERRPIVRRLRLSRGQRSTVAATRSRDADAHWRPLHRRERLRRAAPGIAHSRQNAPRADRDPRLRVSDRNTRRASRSRRIPASVGRAAAQWRGAELGRAVRDYGRRVSMWVISWNQRLLSLNERPPQNCSESTDSLRDSLDVRECACEIELQIAGSKIIT